MTRQERDYRRAQRLLAFQVLYSQEFQSCATEEDLKHAFASVPPFVSELEADDGVDSGDIEKFFSAPPEMVLPEDGDQDGPGGFGWELVLGVWRNRSELDAVIARFARNWRLDRLGRAELNILRLGTYEMLYRSDIPPRVTINEALELDKQFGDPRSSSFVNGILDAVCKAKERNEIQEQA